MRFPQTGCWHRFTTADWQFILESLSLDGRSREGLASLCDDPDEAGKILDHPKLFDSLVVSRKTQTAFLSPELFFFVVIRTTLKRIGLADIEVADYMAVVCSDFGMPVKKELQASREDQPLYHLDYQQALESAPRSEKFFIHVECANQFLVLTCLYPSYLHRRAERRGAPDLEYYERVVMSHLDAAGHHALAGEFDLDDVLMKLAGAFPPVRRAMNHTMREYLSLGA